MRTASSYVHRPASSGIAGNESPVIVDLHRESCDPLTAVRREHHENGNGEERRERRVDQVRVDVLESGFLPRQNFVRIIELARQSQLVRSGARHRVIARGGRAMVMNSVDTKTQLTGGARSWYNQQVMS